MQIDIYGSTARIGTRMTLRMILLVLASMTLFFSSNFKDRSIAISVLMVTLVSTALYKRKHMRLGAHVFINDFGIQDRRGIVDFIQWEQIDSISKHYDRFFGDHLSIRSSILTKFDKVQGLLNDMEYVTDGGEYPVWFRVMNVKFSTLNKSIDDVWPLVAEACLKRGFVSDNMSLEDSTFFNASARKMAGGQIQSVIEDENQS